MSTTYFYFECLGFFKPAQSLFPSHSEGSVQPPQWQGRTGGPQGRSPCAWDTRDAKTPSPCSSGSGDAIADAKLRLRNPLLSSSIGLPWGFCTLVKLRSNLCCSGNNHALLHLLSASLKTQDKAFNLCKVVSHYSFLLNSALMGKHGNLFSNKCLLCSSKMPMARKIVGAGVM